MEHIADSLNHVPMYVCLGGNDEEDDWLVEQCSKWQRGMTAHIIIY